MFTIPRAVFFHYFLTSYFKVLTVQSALPTQQAFHLPTFLKSEMLTKKKGRIVFKPDVAELLIPDCLLYILCRSDKELLFLFYMEILHFCNLATSSSKLWCCQENKDVTELPTATQSLGHRCNCSY